MSFLHNCTLVSLIFGLSIAHADEEPSESSETAEATTTEATAERWASLVIQVYDRESASESLIAQAESQEGWFSSLNDSQVSFRIPSAELESFLEFARQEGKVVSRDYQSKDRSAELTDLRTKLTGREEILARYMEVLEEARSGSIVRVEQQITSAIAEIETIKGRIIFLENRIEYAQVSISFQFRDRSAPIRTGHSSFRWLNDLNVADLMADFHRSGKGRAPAKGLKLPVPEGFAAYHERKRLRAASPDGVVYRVRVQKNKPEADLAFWEEAMRTRMFEAGYHLVDEQRIQSGDREGALLELSAADGENDQSYLVAVFVDGSKLIVFEAAGEVERFGPRQDAIHASITSSF
jgi:hypothetical protein